MHTRVKHVPTLTNPCVQKKWVDQVRKAASSEQQFLADLQIDAKTLEDWYTAPIVCVFWFYVSSVVCPDNLRNKLCLPISDTVGATLDTDSVSSIICNMHNVMSGVLGTPAATEHPASRQSCGNKSRCAPHFALLTRI